MKEIKKCGIIAASLLSVFYLSMPKANAHYMIRPANDRYGFASHIMQDNLENDFGPATDRLIEEKEKLQVKAVIKKENQGIQQVSNVKFDNTTKVKVDSIIFSGNKVFNSTKLNKYASSLIGREVTAQDLADLASRITDLYQKAGYITSRAVFDPKNIKDGKVEITVIEGKIGSISIDNNKWARTSYVRNNLLKANDLQENKVFNVNNLNDSYSEINGNNYIKGEVTLQENKADSDKTDIQLNVKDRLPISFTPQWDNMGRYNTGVARALLNISDNNLTGFGDKLYVTPIFARDSFGVNTGYNIPVGPYGTEFRFGYSYVHANTDHFVIEPFDQYPLNGSSSAHLFRASLVQPLYKNNHLYLLSDLSFDMMHTKNNCKYDNFYIGNEHEDLRVLRTGISGVEEDKFGKLLSRIEVSTGLPILGGTDESGYGIPSSKFFKIDANLLRSVDLPYKFTSIIKLKGQYSPDTLPEFEAFDLGGMNSIRGFDQGLLDGDRGYMASFELQRPIPYLRDFDLPYWPNKTIPVKLKDKIKFAVFYDQGYAKQIHIGEPNGCYQFLQSVGAGLRIKLTKFLQAKMDLGIPLGRDRSTDQTGVKFIFSISSDLL